MKSVAKSGLTLTDWLERANESTDARLPFCALSWQRSQAYYWHEILIFNLIGHNCPCCYCCNPKLHHPETSPAILPDYSEPKDRKATILWEMEFYLPCYFSLFFRGQPSANEQCILISAYPHDLYSEDSSKVFLGRRDFQRTSHCVQDHPSSSVDFLH